MTAAKAAAKETKAAPKKAAPKKAASKKGAPVAHGVGRRKASVARVWFRKNGTGVITVNDRSMEDYFDTITTRKAVVKPMKYVPAIASFDIDVNVKGGGTTGQADATALAISRAMVEVNPECKSTLRDNGLLTVDARVVERKKAGQPGARRKFQFVKR